MKIMEIPQFGPMYRFSDADVYWALYLLSDGKKLGRKKLSDSVGIGEGSMRRIIDTLKEWGFIDVKQTGISITSAGLGFLNQIPMRVVNIPVMPDSIVGDAYQAVLVLGHAKMVDNGMQQRDAGIKAGANGCTTIVLRKGILMIPPDWNIDENNPEIASKIREVTGITEDDVIIVGAGRSHNVAMEAAINAAFELI